MKLFSSSRLLYTVITLLFIDQVLSLSESTIDGTLKNIPEDGLYNFSQMADKYGHPAIVHQVTTEDKYILTLINMPGDKNRTVLLNHGVFDSSDGWVLRGKTSMAIMLADAGYDVWVLNARGCRYSRKHETLNPDTDAKFWDYSAHEMGFYDLRANIDFILNATGQSQLSVVGFSEGSTMFLILTALKPEYNDKIKVAVGLAPIAYLQNTVGPLNVLIHLGPFLDSIIPKFINEIAGFHSLSKAIINLLCTQLVIGYDFCFGGMMSPMMGTNLDAVEKSFFDVIIGHFPAGTSKKNLIHFSQIGMRGIFAAYDYGTVKNLQVYGSFVPPSYDLRKVRMPVYLVSGENDRVSSMADVEILNDELPNVQEWKILDDPLYNHLDHLWAKDAHKVVYSYVMEKLAKYN